MLRYGRSRRGRSVVAVSSLPPVSRFDELVAGLDAHRKGLDTASRRLRARRRGSLRAPSGYGALVSRCTRLMTSASVVSPTAPRRLTSRWRLSVRTWYGCA